MLSELRISNYAVIEDLSLRFEPGLVVLTGETGAGKSIIVGALSLVLGERAATEVVRAGEQRAVVEAVFDVNGRDDLRLRCDDAGIDASEGWLVLKREVNVGGRSRAWVNGSATTATLVGELGRALVDLHGQHEHQTLLHPAPQREILDEFGGASETAAEVRQLFEQLGEARRRRREVEEQRARTEDRAEYLRHQAEEIEAASVQGPEEDLALAEEERRLAHGEELLERASSLHDRLYAADDAVYDRLSRLRREFELLAGVDPTTPERFAELFDTVYYGLQEIAERLATYRDSIDLNPSRLESVRGRIDTLYRLKSKYGPTLQDVIAAGRRAREELESLDLAGFEIEKLEKVEAELAGRLEEEAARLTRLRGKAAKALAVEVTRLLPELGMPDGRFELSLKAHPAVSAHGSEGVEFLVTLNRGFDPLPLSRVASGGELSRVMLALKTILARLDRTPTLIFDEIDSGIGGIVGQRVAERLRAVARHHQVFVITHLPQIAALADHHLLVTKASGGRGRARGGKAATTVAELQGEDRVRDLARMLGGDPEREASLEHARALLGTP